jgi:hypothetical protein
MFTEPKHGWTNLQLGCFESRASYLTDIPMDCLDGFIYALSTNNPITIFFDAEGWDFHLVSSYYESYIISNENDESDLYLIEGSFKELAKELIGDIEKYFDSWLHWEYFDLDEEDELKERKEKLNNKLLILKGLVEKTS